MSEQEAIGILRGQTLCRDTGKKEPMGAMIVYGLEKLHKIK